MGISDVRNRHRLRLRNLNQIINFSEMVHSHLDHRHLRLMRKAKQRLRKSDVVVVIACGLKGFVFLRKDGRNHVLRGGLSD